MIRVVSASQQMKYLLSTWNATKTATRRAGFMARTFKTRAFAGFIGKKQKTQDETHAKFTQLLKAHEGDAEMQAGVQAAYWDGYRSRLLLDQPAIPTKSPLRRLFETFLTFIFCVWFVDFAVEVKKEYDKIKAERENGGSGGGESGEVGGEKGRKAPLGIKKGESQKEDSAGPIKNLSMKVDLDIKQTKPEEIKVRFNDVKGVDEAREELEFIVDFLKDPGKFSRLGGTLPKGVLLVGNPGVGKTLLAKAVAGEAGVPFFYASGSEFDEVYVGMGARRMRQLFSAAKKAQPCVLFIDEVDSCGAKRISSQMHPFANHTVNQMLTEMDGFAKNSGVIVLGATNRRENLDEALLRPGRFDVEVTIPLPDVKGREDILRLYLSRMKVSPELDVKIVAKGTPGFSGADLENLVNQAAVRAAKERRDGITKVDIEWAKDKLMMGPEKKGKTFDAETIKNTAYHEAGHTAVAYFTKGSDPIHKVTIVPRGRTFGHTAFVPSESNRTKEQLMAHLDVAMGGRIGEQILDDEQKIGKGVTPGASSDFQSATSIASAMVKKYGMSPLVGMRVFDGEMEEVANATKKIIDTEIKRLLDESYERAVTLLKTHAEAHKKLAEALVDKETLDAREIAEILGPRSEEMNLGRDEEEGRSNDDSSRGREKLNSRPGDREDGDHERDRDQDRSRDNSPKSPADRSKNERRINKRSRAEGDVKKKEKGRKKQRRRKRSGNEKDVKKGKKEARKKGKKEKVKKEKRKEKREERDREKGERDRDEIGDRDDHSDKEEEAEETAGGRRRGARRKLR